MDLIKKSPAKRRRGFKNADQLTIGVIGTGYVGLVAGVCFAELGHSVICVDINTQRVAALAHGDVPYYEPGLEPRLVGAVRSGRIGFTTDIGLAAREASVLFITAGTPSAPDGSSDTSAIFAIARQIAVSATAPRTLVIKSTAPVGTAAAVQDEVDQVRPGLIRVLVNPEFLREGSAVQDFVEPKRIVIGADNPEDAAPLLAIYRPLASEAPRMVVSRESAELGKYAANAFLATRVSFINEISDLSAAVGANVLEVRDIAGLDPRVGSSYMHPGLGYGGSCLPKDLRAIEAMARKNDVSLKLLPQVSAVNQQRARRLVSIVEQHFGGSVSGHKLAVWGLSFKPETDDVRESPALSLIRELVQRGARVSVYDPQAMHSGAAALNIAVSYGTDMYGAADRAEALVVATEWRDFTHADWQRVSMLMARPLVFDGRGVLDRKQLNACGLEVFGFEARVKFDRETQAATEMVKEVA